jgi:hypothetical protein
VFSSYSTLVPEDTDQQDIFVHDRYVTFSSVRPARGTFAAGQRASVCRSPNWGAAEPFGVAVWPAVWSIPDPSGRTCHPGQVPRVAKFVVVLCGQLLHEARDLASSGVLGVAPPQ